MSSSIVMDPRRVGGSPTIEGTRIHPEIIAHYLLESGYEETLHSYPHLHRDDVLIACWYIARYDLPKRWTAKQWARLKGWVVANDDAMWSQDDWTEVPLP